MRKLIIFLIALTLVGFPSAVSYWVDNFNNCPTNYMSLTCTGTKLVCGYSGTTYCSEPAVINPPAVTATSNLDKDAGSFNGGYLIDCYAYDGTAPFCDNAGAFWCDYNTTCYTTKHRDTTCTANMFGASTCGSCRTNRGDCSGDDDCETTFSSTACAVGANNNVPSCGNCYCNSGAFDCDGGGNGTGNGCEILNGAACAAGSNNKYSGCAGAVGNCICQTNYNDCDGLGPGVGNGCEIHNGDACSIGGLSGTYSGCSGAVGNCIVPKSYFETGTDTNYSTTNPLLWGHNFGLGWLMNLSNSTNSSLVINQNACIVFPDTTSQCTAASGGYTYAQIATNLGNHSADMPAIYSNITSLQTSNTSIWTQFGLISSNFTSFTTSNSSIWTWLGNLYSNVTNLQTSNTSIWTWLGTNYINVTGLQTSNASIWSQFGLVASNFTSFTTSNTSLWTWLGTNYLNMTALQTSNTSIWTWLGTNYLNVTGLQTSNTSTNNRITAVNNTLNTLINNVSSISNYSADKTVLYLNITGLNTTKVPYTGATGAVDLGSYNITAQNYSITGSPGYINGNATCFRLMFNSTVGIVVGSACG